MKKHRCKICTGEYVKFNSLQKTCGFTCEAELARQTAIKKRRKDNEIDRRQFLSNDRSHQTKKAVEACNLYIRTRDAGLPCVSCDATNYTLTAGHYRPAGTHPALRFDETNIHGQCWWNCNKNKSGNLIEYRKRLIVRVGIEQVEYLEREHGVPNRSIDDLKDIQKYFRDKTKRLKEAA